MRQAEFSERNTEENGGGEAVDKQEVGILKFPGLLLGRRRDPPRPRTREVDPLVHRFPRRSFAKGWRRSGPTPGGRPGRRTPPRAWSMCGSSAKTCERRCRWSRCPTDIVPIYEEEDVALRVSQQRSGEQSSVLVYRAFGSVDRGELRSRRPAPAFRVDLEVETHGDVVDDPSRLLPKSLLVHRPVEGVHSNLDRSAPRDDVKARVAIDQLQPSVEAARGEELAL